MENSVEKIAEQANTSENPAVEDKTSKISTKHFVKAGEQPAVLLKLDAEGEELVFDNREDFVPLSEEEIRMLSSGNRTRYHVAASYHKTWLDTKNDEIVRKFVIEGGYDGTAAEKINGVTCVGNLVGYWTRPDRLGRNLQIGWRVAGADEVRTFVKATGTHVEIGQMGRTELVLVVMPKELYEKRQQKKSDKASGRLEAIRAQAEAEADRLKKDGVRKVRDMDFHPISVGGSEE